MMDQQGTDVKRNEKSGRVYVVLSYRCRRNSHDSRARRGTLPFVQCEYDCHHGV